MAAPNVLPMQVLNQLMDNGLFDTLRKSITAELENNMELKRFTTEEVTRSQVLQAPGAERRSRRELFEALRRELQNKVLERASEAAWKAILSKEGVGLQIEEQVEKTWWELNGWGTPPERVRPPPKKPAEQAPVETQQAGPLASVVPNSSGVVIEPEVPASKERIDEPQDQPPVVGAGTQVALPESEAGPSNDRMEEVQYVPLIPEPAQKESEGDAEISGSARNGGAEGLAAESRGTEDATPPMAEQEAANQLPEAERENDGDGLAANSVPAAEMAKSVGGGQAQAAAPVDGPVPSGDQLPLSAVGALGGQELGPAQGAMLGADSWQPEGGPPGMHPGLHALGGSLAETAAETAVEEGVQEKRSSAVAWQAAEDQPRGLEGVTPNVEVPGQSGDLEGGALTTDLGATEEGAVGAVGVRGTGPFEVVDVPPLATVSKETIPSSPIEMDAEVMDSTPVDTLGHAVGGDQTGLGQGSSLAEAGVERSQDRTALLEMQEEAGEKHQRLKVAALVARQSEEGGILRGAVAGSDDQTETQASEAKATVVKSIDENVVGSDKQISFSNDDRGGPDTAPQAMEEG